VDAACKNRQGNYALKVNESSGNAAVKVCWLRRVKSALAATIMLLSARRPINFSRAADNESVDFLLDAGYYATAQSIVQGIFYKFCPLGS
jgi:hypothetical protein